MADLTKSTYRKKFTEFNCCILIPTYNNAHALAGVINDVLEYTSNIVIINDGSTDNTREILQSFPDITVHHQPKNMGKGMALRTGFKVALEKGYHYAITIDSDGQHMAEDLPVFIDKLELEPGSIIIGARNMDQATVPGKSNFGNKFSNFWFWFETGITLPDTQSGYRLYPLRELKDFKWFTVKYEFEIEVIVRAAWKGIKVLSVPVKVYYAPKEERVSHFRPFKDFSRVGVLNTVLVTLAILYHKPLKVLKSLHPKSIAGFVKKNIFSREESDLKKTLSVMFGVFMGIFPIWGFQLLVGIPLSHFFRLNKAIFIMAAHISIPPMIPVIIFLSYYTGGIILGTGREIPYSGSITVETVREDMYQYVAGAVLFSFIAAAIFGIITYGLLKMFPRKNSDLSPSIEI
ncbi:MAG: DUF2062 domain-containing protein [Cytophagaceae bacterium]